MPTRFDPAAVLLSLLLAAAASFVSLELLRRMRTAEPLLVPWWCAGGAVAMGTGIWATHFVGMLAFHLPVAVGYETMVTALSWLAAVLMALPALWLASRARLGWRGVAPAALVLGLGISAMHYIGMGALHLQPGIRWQPALVAASVGVAVGFSGLALWVFQQVPRFAGLRGRAWQGVAAALLAAAIGGLHYLGMAAAVFPAGALCLSADQLRGDGLALLVAGAALVLLVLTYASVLLDERMQARANGLALSLQLANDELQRAVLYDSLTSLPNRRLLFERLAEVAGRCDREGRRAALLFIDLDGFKPLNDLFGHGFGDAVLCEVSHRLKSIAGSGDTVARLGGDEFVLLLADIADPSAVRQVALQLIAALQRPLQLGRREARLSASVGIAVYPEDGAASKLLAAADAAMYAAKRDGGAQAAFFTPQLEAETRGQVELQRDLRSAIDNPQRGELSLHYQPKVDAASGRITGVEALLRWHHPERGAIGPALFIPVAERFGLIDRLGAWVIAEACRQARAWQGQGLWLRVAVNLSMHQLRQPGLVDRVQATLQDHGLQAASLMFEITESAAMDDADATGRIFDALAALGTELAIDDFGTGYSSLAWLRRLPSRQVKIDRSFVKDLDSRSDARAIVEAVVHLAHALGLGVVAEGVETERQRELLLAMGCDELQGYLFARPVPGDTLLRWARGHDRSALIHFDAASWRGMAEEAPAERRLETAAEALPEVVTEVVMGALAETA